MANKKELKKLKKRLKSLDKDFTAYQAKTDKQFSQIEGLLTDFNEKLTAMLTIRKTSSNGNGIAHKKPVKKK